MEISKIREQLFRFLEANHLVHYQNGTGALYPLLPETEILEKISDYYSADAVVTQIAIELYRQIIGHKNQHPNLSPQRWLAVANPQAGNFKADKIAAQLKDRDIDISVYETVANPDDRVDQIARHIETFNPSESNPLGILSFGGDGTLSDTLKGILIYLFPACSVLTNAPSSQITETMLSSGIQLGVIQQGTANDLGTLSDAPKANLADIIDFMNNAGLVSLNMGVAFLDNATAPILFPHTLSAGTVIAGTFEDTKDSRGKGATWGRIRSSVERLVRLEGVEAEWNDGTVTRTDKLAEFISHAIPRASLVGGIPGTPQDGLGVKIFRSHSRLAVFRGIFSSLFRGLGSHVGVDQFIGEDRLLGGVDRALQPKITKDPLVIEFSRRVPVQANGDFVRQAQHLKIHRLPSFPRLMVRRNSILTRMQMAKTSLVKI